MTPEAQIAVLHQQVLTLTERVTKAETEIQRIEDQEQAKWRWGVSALGAVVMALGGVIWSYRSIIFQAHK